MESVEPFVQLTQQICSESTPAIAQADLCRSDNADSLQALLGLDPLGLSKQAVAFWD
jgi:hypothetical protein